MVVINHISILQGTVTALETCGSYGSVVPQYILYIGQHTRFHWVCASPWICRRLRRSEREVSGDSRALWVPSERSRTALKRILAVLKVLPQMQSKGCPPSKQSSFPGNANMSCLFLHFYSLLFTARSSWFNTDWSPARPLYPNHDSFCFTEYISKLRYIRHCPFSRANAEDIAHVNQWFDSVKSAWN